MLLNCDEYDYHAGPIIFSNLTVVNPTIKTAGTNK